MSMQLRLLNFHKPENSRNQREITLAAFIYAYIACKHVTRLLWAYRRVIVWKPEAVCSLAQFQSTSVSIFVHFDSKITAVYIYSGIQISTKAALISFFVIQMMALQICWLCPHLKLAQIFETQECDQRVLYKRTEAHSPKHASYHVFSLSAGWNEPHVQECEAKIVLSWTKNLR